MIAHTNEVERHVLVQPRGDGSASVLFWIKVPERLKSAVDATWIDTALLDVELRVDGHPAACDARWQGAAVLWECPPGRHWRLLLGSHLATSAAFVPAGTAYAPAALQEGALKQIREVEWLSTY